MYNILKQMISKYFLWTSVLILNILLFSSCLNSSDNYLLDRPTDPQIYAISLSSKTDSVGVLTDVSFTIDQINGEIFNKEPLPYLFHVDSISLSLSSSNTYFPFYKVELTLTGSPDDSTYIWNQLDSIALPRLKKIKTTSPDGLHEKTYQFKLGIYQSDPYIIDWNRIKDSYLAPPVGEHRTIAHENDFYTYYRSGSGIKAYSAPISENPEWTEASSLSGMPDNILLTSLITCGGTQYALTPSGAVYRSDNAITWNEVSTSYEVKAIYGELPFVTQGSVLLAVNDGETLKFAKTSEAFSEIVLMNNIPENMPITDFSALTVESSTVYANKFIFISGGKKADNTSNNDIWVLQESNGIITFFTSQKPDEGILEGSSLFFYDDQPYLITTTSTGKNLLMYSNNYGAEWSNAGENQAFPSEPVDFTARKYASVITDNNNNIWIFGGISLSDTQIGDIWKGRLNKFNQN